MNPILYVTHDLKWYEFALELPDGNLTTVEFDELEAYAAGLGVSPYVDHVPNPIVVGRMCDARGWDIDPISHELMIGRWVLEALGGAGFLEEAYASASGFREMYPQARRRGEP